VVSQKGDPVSPRAVKHAQELTAIALAGQQKACLLFIVQRIDVDRLRITTQDVVYREAVREAIAKGVDVRAFAVRWDGPRAFLHKELPLDWEE
jgi:sugar fermentation stimulation protein A